MKITFNSLDIACAVYELQRLVGMRVNQIYDVDPKTYIFKLHRNDEKATLLLESGSRFHTTTFDWPKSNSPSGFTMKLRKHLRNKRIEAIHQLGKDRIVDFSFGTGIATYHVILELFNRGNILLLDHTLVILNVLRPHTEGDKKFAVKEEYPIGRVRLVTGPPNISKLTQILTNAKKGEKLSKILLPHLDYGSALIEHLIMAAGMNRNTKYTGPLEQNVIDILAEELWIGEEIMKHVSTTQSKGYIILRSETIPGQDEELITYQEFHPYLFFQHAAEQYTEFPNFNAAVDEFFSKTEGQKIELRALHKEKEAFLKVERIKENQKHRVEGLIFSQENNKRKGELILENSSLVDEVISIIRRAISIQMPWPDISTLITDMSRHNHPIGKVIHELKLETNQVTLKLSDPYCDSENPIEHEGTMLVDIDLAMSACGNASRYYFNKKSAELKEKKTIEAQDKAIKSAEKKAKQTLKDIQTMTTITKARKTYWFEKFFWFISSDNFLVIGGRDQQQNEIVVKRYLKKGDLYVHADLHGASSVVIKNPSEENVPPRTLNEAGNMAVCYSIGWEAKVVCSAWWVHYDQVSKTAPTGEYLQTGSFMIRGQKNYLLPSSLTMGFAFMFKVEESSAFRHQEERKAKVVDTEDGEELEITLSDSGVDISNGTNEVDDQQENEEDEAKCSQPCESENHIDEFPEPKLKLLEGMENIYLEHTEDVSVLAQPHFVDETPLGSPGIVFCTKNVNAEKKQKDKNGKVGKVETDEKDKKDEKDEKEKSTPKRGQRGKLKKIKEKYKDQDEEEKQLRMSILQSAGAKKEPKKGKKQAGKTRASSSVEQRLPADFSEVVNKNITREPPEGELDDDEIITSELHVLDYLTGQPHPDDELLFAIPVVAPYSALLNYKYKVKLVPGTGKRGKCSRTAVDYYTKMKDCTPQEKALIRSVNDQILSRNFPGKVKISVGQMKK